MEGRVRKFLMGDASVHLDDERREMTTNKPDSKRHLSHQLTAGVGVAVVQSSMRSRGDFHQSSPLQKGPELPELPEWQIGSTPVRSTDISHSQYCGRAARAARAATQSACG